jgi:dTDP-glucose pyrophosphorylase
MKKPILVVLAAGMGSRYGGLKQMDPVGPSGEFIIDYSIYDAHRAGFETVLFIIKHEIEKEFKETVGSRVSKYMEVRYAYQQVDMLPEGYSVPEGRVKPWGTGHAVLCAAEELDAPFVVINSDDYYGPQAYQVAYDYLTTTQDDADKCHYAMVGYLLKNTVTENGSVARGVCELDQAGNLVVIRTVSGMAMAVAAALDAMNWPEIAGCIAGDDTIFCAVHTQEEAERVMEKIRENVQ